MFVECTITYPSKARLYREFAVDQYTVMLWLNACHLIVVGGVLLGTGEGPAAARFLAANPACAVLVGYLGGLAAASQLVVLYLIRRFGPVVFTVLMSSRQMAAVCVSGLACLSTPGLAAAGGAAGAVMGPAAGRVVSPTAGAVVGAAGWPGTCTRLWLVLGRPVPLVSAAATLSLLASRAVRAQPLAVELRSFPAEIDVS